MDTCACALCIVHCALCIVHCALCIVHCALCIVPLCHCAIVHCALCIVHCALCIVHCALCSVQCALCIVHCALCIVHCACACVWIRQGIKLKRTGSFWRGNGFTFFYVVRGVFNSLWTKLIRFCYSRGRARFVCAICASLIDVGSPWQNYQTLTDKMCTPTLTTKT